MSNKPTFPERLRTLRQQANLTQAQLAEACGRKQSFIALLESGARQPSWETVQALATALKVGVNMLC